MIRLYASDKVVVEQDEAKWETYKVLVTGKRARTFKGETAWSDAERYAGDHDMAAWGCTSQ